MRKISTHISVYAILLIAAFYGSNFFTVPQGKSSPNAEVITLRPIASTELKLQTVTPDFQLAKNNKPKAAFSVTLYIKRIYATTGAELNSFNHSATLHKHTLTIYT